MNAVTLTEYNDRCKNLFGYRLALTFGVVITQNNHAHYQDNSSFFHGGAYIQGIGL